MVWKPLLTGEARSRALEIASEIASALAAEPRGEPGFPDPGPTLAGGTAGIALFHAYLEQAGLGGGERADALLGEAVDAVAEKPLGSSLYSGFTGIAWAADHMTGGGAGDEEDANEEIDAALLDHLSQTPWHLDYDLIVGLVGHGVYALERVQRESGRRCLERVIDRLADTAVEVEGAPGVTWWTGPHLMIPTTREANPGGYYNTGLAHGVPGVVALLGGAIEAGVAVEKARPLLARAMDWLLAQRDPSAGIAQFPYTVSIPRVPERHPVRAAWCYGDPGVAVALLAAARGAAEPAWETVALEVARHVARRDPATCGVVDAGLCHGAAGLAHIYNRMYQATGDELLADAARLWTERLFALRKPGEGIAGWLAYVPGAAMELGWEPDPSLLTGAAGVGLALLGLATEHEPRWDRMLLTNVTPR